MVSARTDARVARWSERNGAKGRAKSGELATEHAQFVASPSQPDHNSGQMKSIAVTEFKAQCLSLLEDVARTGEPLLVTKRGKPLARVTASGNVAITRPQDTLRGSVEYEGDLVSPAAAPGAWEAAGAERVGPPAGPTVQKARPRRGGSGTAK